MPRLEILRLGGTPCRTPSGVTAKGLTTLAHYCPHLSTLRVHFQVASLDPLLLPEPTAGSEPAIPPEDCVLTHLNVGEMPLPEKSALAVALTLLCIFPRIDYIESLGGGGRNLWMQSTFPNELPTIRVRNPRSTSK